MNTRQIRSSITPLIASGSKLPDKAVRTKLSRLQREILVGILLGDGHLETQNKGKSYRLKYSQCEQHKEYLFLVYSFFKEWCKSPPKQRIKKSEVVIVGPDGVKKITSQLQQRVSWEFSTKSDPAFRFYAHQFYPKHSDKKRIPAIIHRILTPTGLAFWFQDDGSIKSKQSKGLIFNTHGFTLPDIKRICYVLKTKFNLEAKPRFQKDGYQIYISGYSFETAAFLMEQWLSSDIKRVKWPKPRLPAKLVRN